MPERPVRRRGGAPLSPCFTTLSLATPRGRWRNGSVAEDPRFSLHDSDPLPSSWSGEGSPAPHPMRDSILLPHLAPRGVRTAPRPEAPAHSSLLTAGDVPAEYGAAREGCVLFDATDRGLLRVRGADATDFLHRLLSNRVTDLPPGRGCRNLLLTPKGRIRFDLDLAIGEDEILLSTPPANAPALAEALDAFRFTEAVEIEEITETHAPLELAGPRSGEILETILGELPDLEERAWRCVAWSGGEARLTPLAVAGLRGWRIDAGPDGACALWDALEAAGAVAAGIVVRDILRVEAASPLHGVDIDENVYPQEAGLDDAFSLDKGCYIGQEVVAKIDSYGGVNKRLVSLRIDHDEAVPRGTRLLSTRDRPERDVGVITSWAYSFLLDTGLVLGYVKRKHDGEGTSLRLADGSGTATVVARPAP
jgi:folate-binding protein YgfZ